MKYLKSFENNNDAHLKYEKYISDIKKLSSHLNTVFSEIGYDYSNYYDRGNYETEYRLNGYLVFNIKIMTAERTLNIMVINDSSEIFDYFKLVKGLQDLKITGYSTTDTTTIIFKIIGKISNLIKNIKKEDVETFISSSKYNL